VNASASRAFRRLVAVAAASAVAALGGCGTWKTYLPDIEQIGIYRLDINQGNFLTQDMVDKLKVGQTRQQVRQVLGTPLLTDAFHDNRWDYVYSYTRAGKVVEKRQFTVYFVDDKLARWEGDEVPVSAAQLNRIAADRTLAPEPGADDKGYVERFLDFLKGNW
jgi:outer membrane protein assembly factor BamE